MPFSTSAHGVFDGFKATITSTGFPATIQVSSVSSAQIGTVPYPQFYVTTDNLGSRFMPIVTKLFLVDNQGTQPVAMETLTRTELGNFFDFVQNNTDNNYRNVKTNQLWRTLYGVRYKNFDTYDSKTNQVGTKQYYTTYCQRCNVVLPLRNLTIDHQKPQQGGDVEAMLRVFRAAGLTVSTGVGQKNRYLQGQVAQSVGGNTTVLPRGGQRGSDQDRYTLSNKGALYFTALQHYNMVGEMKNMSMHHIANLRPMCGPCNSGLRNSNVTFWLDT